MSAAGSEDEDYHSAEEEREVAVTEERDTTTDAADVSRGLQEATLTEKENESKDSSTEKVAEKAPEESLTDEEIAVKQEIPIIEDLLFHNDDFTKERKEQAGQLKATGNETFKRGGALDLKTLFLLSSCWSDDRVCSGCRVLYDCNREISVLWLCTRGCRVLRQQSRLPPQTGKKKRTHSVSGIEGLFHMHTYT